MAMDQKNEKDTQGKRKSGEKRGFYIALAVCLAAIGIAAWSTYDTVSGFLEPVSGSAQSTSSAAATKAPSAMATPAADDPEDAVSGGHAQGTASEVQVEAEPEEPATAPAEEPEAEETAPADAPVDGADGEAPAEETAVQPEYTVSVGFKRPVESDTLLLAYSEDPVYSETMRDYRAHLGADYAAAHGETVKAIANGLVKETYTDMLLGNIIVIEHGAYAVRYCGLGETFLVEPGEVVSAGQDIGSVTAAPFESAMESHLHLEVTENGEPFNPENLFG